MSRFNRYSRKLPKKTDLVNKEIRFPVVMVIGENGPLGQMSPRDGMAKAQAQGLDLVCVSPSAKPPICKILDYGKYKFEKSKKQKEMKKNRSVVVLKEVRITPNIGQHDLETKAKKAKEFILQGSKVKVSLKFRGRERAHTDVGEETLMKFFKVVEDIAMLEKRPYSNGRFFDMIIAPQKSGKKPQPQKIETKSEATVTEVTDKDNKKVVTEEKGE